MNLTLSPQIKILALVGVLAIVGLLASMTLLGHSSSPSATSTPTRTIPRATTTTAPPKAATTTTHATTTPAKTATRQHAVAKQAHHTATKHVVRGLRVYATLPPALQWQLSQHGVVVVSTYDPNADVDAIAANEAHAGALDAKAGFLLVNLLDNSVAGRLTALLPGGGLLPDPGVLVYKAPGNIVYRFDGFVDRDTVAQAAANALAGQVGTAVSASGGATTTPAG